MSKEAELAEIHAGFPSPAEDFMDVALDLNKELVRNPSSTFFARVKGDSMIEDGVNDGDMLIIDKGAKPSDGCLAVCFVDGEFTLKRYLNKGNYAILMPANKKYKPIRVDADNQFAIWGVVKYLIKKL